IQGREPRELGSLPCAEEETVVARREEAAEEGAIAIVVGGLDAVEALVPGDERERLPQLVRGEWPDLNHVTCSRSAAAGASARTAAPGGRRPRSAGRPGRGGPRRAPVARAPARRPPAAPAPAPTRPYWRGGSRRPTQRPGRRARPPRPLRRSTHRPRGSP